MDRYKPSIAQLVERLTVDQMVPGSIPGRRTFFEFGARTDFNLLTLRALKAVLDMFNLPSG